MEEKKNFNKWRIAITYLAVFFIGVWIGSSNFSYNNVDVDKNSNNNLVTTTNNQANNVFNWDNIRVGDLIGSWKVKEIREYNIGSELNFWENANITFTGNVELEGVYYNVFDKICFKPNKDSQKIVPVMSVPGGKTSNNFCFENQNSAKILAENFNQDDQIKIVISDFVLNAYPSEITNIANLVKIK